LISDDFHGFYCKRLAVAAAVDVMGNAHVLAPQDVPDLAQAKKNGHEKIHRRVKDLCDVDVKRFTDPALYQTSLDESAERLRSALYDKQNIESLPRLNES